MQRGGYGGAYGPYHQSQAWEPTANVPQQNGTPQMSYPSSSRAPYHRQSSQVAAQNPSNIYNTHGSFGASDLSVADTQQTHRRTSVYERAQPSESMSNTECFSYTPAHAGQQQQQQPPPSPYVLPGTSWGSATGLDVDESKADDRRYRPSNAAVSPYSPYPTYQTAGASGRSPVNTAVEGRHHGLYDLQRPQSVSSQRVRAFGDQKMQSTVSQASSIPNNSLVTPQKSGMKQTHGHDPRSADANATTMPNLLHDTNGSHPEGSSTYLSARGNIQNISKSSTGPQTPSSQHVKASRSSATSTIPLGGRESTYSTSRNEVKGRSLDSRSNSAPNDCHDQHHRGLQHEVPQDEEIARKLVAATKAIQSDHAAQNASIVRSPENSASVAFPPSSSQAPDHDMNADSAVKDQMELDMKKMIERMRHYKSKDPSLFVQIWDQVKKALPSQMAPSQATPKSTTSPTTSGASVVSPALSTFPLDGPVEENHSTFPPGFDRGRFPAQRRRRGGLHGGTPTRLMSSAKTAAGPPQSPRPSLALQKSSPAPLAQMVAESAVPSRQVASGPQVAREFTTGQAPPEAAPLLDRDIDGPASLKHFSASSISELPSGVTHWPEDKKRALAEAASILLTKEKEGTSKKITPREILEILDRNPSYSQVCEYFKSQGFEFDQAVLARDLLHRISDLSSTPSSLCTPNKQPRATDATQPSLPQVLSTGHLQASRAESRQSISPTSTSAEPATSGSVRAFVSGKALGPVSKELKARKRNFSDLIDLTQLDIEDFDHRHQEKKPRVDQPSVSNIEHLPARLGQSMREDLLKTKLIEPMDKRKDAARRSSYDPKTIVSDVLIVTAKHPTLAPLNAHLNILRSQFEGVDDGSDLSTFRWDLVDPDQAKIVESPTLSISADANDGGRNKPSPMPGAEDAMTFVRKSKKTIPSTSPMKAVVINGSRESLGKDVSPSSPTRIITGQPSSQPDLSSRPLADQSFKQEVSGNTPPHSVAVWHVSGPSQTFVSPMPKRKGRPPGAKNKSPRVDKGLPKKRNSPADPGNTTASSSSAPVNPSNLRNVVTPTHSSSLAVLISSRSPSVSANESNHVKGLSSDILQPDHGSNQSTAKAYPTYKCHWHHCPAELHNMPTLRKHIEKHRSRLNFPFPCEWMDCDRVEPGKARLLFRSQEDWETHLQLHIQQIEAHKGETTSSAHHGSSSKKNVLAQAVNGT